MSHSRQSGKTKVTVYVIVHELFGIYVTGDSVALLPPIVPPCRAVLKDGREESRYHKYTCARFKNGRWLSPDRHMVSGESYSIPGLLPGGTPSTYIPRHKEFSPAPSEKLTLNPRVQPYCQWNLPTPKDVFQLRMVNIPASARPLFTGSPHGNEVDHKVTEISLVQVFEYEKDPNQDLRILGKFDVSSPIDLNPEAPLETVNIHLWAQLEDESGISDEMADEHARDSTNAVASLFDKLSLVGGAHSLSVDDGSPIQLPMALGIRYPELMTLAEKFQMLPSKGTFDTRCSARTCGHGGTLYVAAP